MAMTLWKKDDGFLDLVLKFASILAISLAAQQYYFKLYPVWSKEKQLADATKSLKEVKSQTSALESINSNLRTEKSILTKQVEALKKREKALTKNYENEVQALKSEANKQREKLLTERSELKSGLNSANTKLQSIVQEAVASHIQRFSSEIFQVQLDNIRAGRPDTSLDLRRDALQYIKEHKANSRSRTESAAYDIFQQAVAYEIPEGIVNYTKVLGVYITFQYEPYAKEIMGELQ